jgi:hypothetical protein
VRERERERERGARKELLIKEFCFISVKIAFFHSKLKNKILIRN